MTVHSSMLLGREIKILQNPKQTVIAADDYVDDILRALQDM